MNVARQVFPELADAAVSGDTKRFAELLPEIQARHDAAARDKQRNLDLLHDDPFDLEVQKRIEEAIRQEGVMENMQHALEFSPESFGVVNMLYVNVEVNGIPLKAFVDSGAQRTISVFFFFCSLELYSCRIISKSLNYYSESRDSRKMWDHASSRSSVRFYSSWGWYCESGRLYLNFYFSAMMS